MEAAAHGKSTLGIPKSVGEEFVAADAVGHAAGVVLVAPDGNILLLKRSGEETNYAGHWALPGGGVEFDETPELGALRETREETGHQIMKPMRLMHRVRTPTGLIYHTYAAPADEKFEPTLNGEHSEHRWTALDDLPEDLHPAVRSMLEGQLGLAEDNVDMDRVKTGFSRWSRDEQPEDEVDPMDRFYSTGTPEVLEVGTKPAPDFTPEEELEDDLEDDSVEVEGNTIHVYQ